MTISMTVRTGRYMLRVTTNGVSAIIDQHGKILKRSPQFETHVLSGEAVPHRGATPYVLLGNWPVISLLALILLVAIRAVRKAGSLSLAPKTVFSPETGAID